MGRTRPARASMTRILLSTALLLPATGCSQAPSDPVGLDVSGRWAGALPIRLPEGDWSSGVLSLAQSATTIAGEMVSADGVRYSVSGSLSGQEIELLVEGLPGTSTCAAVGLILSDFTYSRRRVELISGRAFGRCFGTIAGTFELRRLQ